MALQAKWYARLRETGFVDIEYGLENPRFTTHVPDPTAPGVAQSVDYYETAWKVHHSWRNIGRSVRDCRVAELLAMQQGDTGTVRGISRTLRAEGLAPWSTAKVQATLKEIDAAVKSRNATTSLSESLPYVAHYYAAA